MKLKKKTKLNIKKIVPTSQKKIKYAQINLCQTCKSSYEIGKENKKNYETQFKKKINVKIWDEEKNK